MKTPTGDATAKAILQFQQEPIIIVEIEWDESTTRYYSDYEFSLGGHNIENRLIRLPNLASHSVNNAFGMIQTTSITLSDQDLAIKTLLESKVFVKCPVTIYQHFNGNAWADLTVLFKGMLTTPTIFSESNYTVELNFIQNLQRCRLVGDILTQDDLPIGSSYEDYEDYVPEEAFGEALPVCFGNPVGVKMLQVIRTPYSEIESDFDFYDTYVLIRDGWEKFAKGTDNVSEFTFAVDGTIITGTFKDSDNKLYFSDTGEVLDDEDATKILKNNDLKYTGDITLDAVYAGYDPDNPRPGRLYLPDSVAGVNLVGYYIKLEHSGYYTYNLCTSQEGNLCLFRSPFRYVINQPRPKPDIIEYFNPAAGDVIKEIRKQPHAGWSGVLGMDGKVVKPWKVASGERCYLLSNTRTPGSAITIYGEKYIWNGYHLPGENDLLRMVIGKRKLGKKLDAAYVPINIDWEIDVDYEDTVFAGSSGPKCCSVTIKDPFWLRKSEGWDDTFYAVVKTETTMGQNTSDHLKWIINTYCDDYTADDTSFATVKALLTKYPSNFYVDNAPDPFKLCSEIAFQARCGLILNNGKVYIKYLSAEPDSDFNLNDEDIVRLGDGVSDFQIKYSEVEDMYNVVEAEYKDYLWLDKKKVALEKDTSIEAFGKKEKKLDFFIYNEKSLVTKSATFWLNRSCRPWMEIECSTYLAKFAAEIYDAVTVHLDQTKLVAGGSSRLGIVKTVDENDSLMKFVIQLPITCGTTDKHSEYWMDDEDDELPDDLYDKIPLRTEPVSDENYWLPITVLGTGLGSIYNSENKTGQVSVNLLEMALSNEELVGIYKSLTATMMKCKVEAVFDDYLICKPLIGNTYLGQKIYVAKPFDLRRAPFDAVKRAAAGLSADYYSLVYIYIGNDGADYDFRSVVHEDWEGSNSLEEMEYTDYQMIMPPYRMEDQDAEIGDYILAMFIPSGTGVWLSGEILPESGDTEIMWIDLNTNGRGWRSIPYDLLHTPK